MDKLDRLLKAAQQIKNTWHVAYHWDQLTRDELIELSRDDGECSSERMAEILEPVTYLSNEPGPFDSLSEEELLELVARYESINADG
ncbi:MAG: hypothetical protein L6276_12405 [Acetobacterium sp.]|nr:hypothetical protein [Acetobacterium sp.]